MLNLSPPCPRKSYEFLFSQAQACRVIRRLKLRVRKPGLECLSSGSGGLHARRFTHLNRKKILTGKANMLELEPEREREPEPEV